jgi:hypothetical protein
MVTISRFEKLVGSHYYFNSMVPLTLIVLSSHFLDG